MLPNRLSICTLEVATRCTAAEFRTTGPVVNAKAVENANSPASIVLEGTRVKPAVDSLM